MIIFKVGQKVRRVGTTFQNVKQGEVYTVKTLVGTRSILLEEVTGCYLIEAFVIAKPEEKFDMINSPWYILTPTPEISELVQKWLFERGHQWQTEGEEVQYTEKGMLTGGYGDRNITWATSEDVTTMLMMKNEEIKFDTELVIKEVTMPLTQKQKEIAALKKIIANAQEQLEKLEG